MTISRTMRRTALHGALIFGTFTTIGGAFLSCAEGGGGGRSTRYTTPNIEGFDVVIPTAGRHTIYVSWFEGDRGCNDAKQLPHVFGTFQ